MFDSFYATNDHIQSALFGKQRLSASTQTHVAAVYGNLALTILACMIGANTHLYSPIIQGGWISALLGFVCMFYISATPVGPYGDYKRRVALYLFGFLEGLTLGPLVERLIDAYPGVLTMALGTTLVTFVSFSLFAILSSNRMLLYLGGMLASALSTLFWISLANSFFGIRALYTAELYLGLALFLGYIVYDTQMMLWKVDVLGLRDITGDCVTLFVDLVAVFVRIAIILAKNREEEENRKRRRR